MNVIRSDVDSVVVVVGGPGVRLTAVWFVWMISVARPSGMVGGFK